MILFAIIIHIVGLHEYGSNNALGIVPKADCIPFTPYYGIKDFYCIIFFLIVFFYFFFIFVILPTIVRIETVLLHMFENDENVFRKKFPF